jgi:hypothetical protein
MNNRILVLMGDRTSTLMGCLSQCISDTCKSYRSSSVWYSPLTTRVDPRSLESAASTTLA